MNVGRKNFGILAILLCFLVLVCGCSLKYKWKATDKPVVNKQVTLSTPTVTITPTISIAPEKSEEESKDKDADIKKAEAKQVLTDFFTAMKEHDSKKASRYCKDHVYSGGGSNIKDTRIIEIKDDVENKQRLLYSFNQGTITMPHDVICFEVTYDMQYVDDNMSTESSGIVTKWFTLIKETKTSPWLIDAWGY